MPCWALPGWAAALPAAHLQRCCWWCCLGRWLLPLVVQPLLLWAWLLGQVLQVQLVPRAQGLVLLLLLPGHLLTWALLTWALLTLRLLWLAQQPVLQRQPGPLPAQAQHALQQQWQRLLSASSYLTMAPWRALMLWMLVLMALAAGVAVAPAAQLLRVAVAAVVAEGCRGVAASERCQPARLLQRCGTMAPAAPV